MHARANAPAGAYLQGGRQITDFEDNLMQATPDTTRRPVFCTKLNFQAIKYTQNNNSKEKYKK